MFQQLFLICLFLPLIFGSALILIDSSFHLEPVASFSPSHLSRSPFYRNEILITSAIQKLIKSKHRKDALEMILQVVAQEKKWRFNTCLQIFDRYSCLNNDTAAFPFYVWKRKLVRQLVKDPTSEVMERIGQNLALYF